MAAPSTLIEYYDLKSSKVGWGHSTWQEAVKLAKAASVKKLVIFHHEPLHDDDFLDGIAQQAHTALPGTILAREGESIDLFASLSETKKESKIAVCG